MEAGQVSRLSRQRLDSTQMLGRVSRPSRLDCVRESWRLAEAGTDARQLLGWLAKPCLQGYFIGEACNIKRCPRHTASQSEPIMFFCTRPGITTRCSTG